MYYEVNNFTQLLKRTDEFSFLKQVPAQVLQQVSKQLERVFLDAFDKHNVINVCHGLSVKVVIL